MCLSSENVHIAYTTISSLVKGSNKYIKIKVLRQFGAILETPEM